MPTLTVAHEAPLELIRQHPDLAVDLVRAMTSVPVPAGGHARLGPTDASSLVPAQFTADSVVIVDDPGSGLPALVIVVEPQGRDDKTKAYAWPAYLANVNRRRRLQGLTRPVAGGLYREAPGGSRGWREPPGSVSLTWLAVDTSRLHFFAPSSGETIAAG
jgi:hypothetical protein